jgi:hypothetical protein
MNPEDADLPRKTYGFKPTQFEVVNKPTGDPGGSGPIDIHELYRKAAPPVKYARPAAAENEVHAILRENLAKASDAGLNDLLERPPRAASATTGSAWSP